MKKCQWILPLLIIGLCSLGHATTYNLDTEKSEIHWVGKKVTGQHNGTVSLKKGKLTLDGDKIIGGTFQIDMATITVLDIQDPKKNQKLTNHLKSDDFFSAGKFPEANFKINSVTQKAPDQVEVKGDLTIKGISNPVVIPATVTKKGNTLHAEGELTLDRTLWEVKYGSGKFFKGLGDKLIHDNFSLKLNLVASEAS